MLTVLTLDGAAEPVTAAEAMLAARIDGNVLTAFVDNIIAMSVREAEHITGRCFRAQTLRCQLDDWPAAVDGIPVHNVKAVSAMEYWNGLAWVALGAGAYTFGPGGRAGMQTAIAPTASWPTLGARPVGPRVRFDLQVEDIDPVYLPAVKLYVIAQVAHWHDNPGAASRDDFAPSPMFERLLNPAKLWT